MLVGLWTDYQSLPMQHWFLQLAVISSQSDFATKYHRHSGRIKSVILAESVARQKQTKNEKRRSLRIIGVAND